MLIYVDTDNGSWGAGESNLVIFDATEDDLWHLERYSDSQIIEFAHDRREERGSHLE